MSVGTIRENVLQTLCLSIKAFELQKCKRETLAYAFHQVEPILKEYMESTNKYELEVDLKNKHCLVFEPVENGERQFWVEQWLDNELSSERLTERLKTRYQWVEYLSFADFLCGVEAWLKLKERVQCG